ncbi:acyltransferase [Enterobacter mori]|uniref:Acyltransferase n=1 Tax=Enterobacter mori TaxID=539813 RepID=A0A7T0H2J0_9ENTR|nr:acyltransferase family protein [Enterobacter mori]QPK02036.1 acyltransferase [Enterobacter mori]
MEFRKDINALRALAIIGVLLFHFDKNLLAGGFSGVDVFFAISGFLMTKIIFTGIEKNNFSVVRFYAARCKRIIPALFFLSVFVVLFGWFFIAPIEYRKLSEHVISSLLFVSNITYWSESSYFASDSSEKWLLHTWSLSVEWQFYLIYPLLVLVSAKALGVRKSRFVMLAIAFISFITSVYMAKAWPTSAFYLLPSRAWEMLAGGMVYLFPITIKKVHAKFYHYAGLLIIVLSYVLLNDSYSWPGYMALPPVIGACMILASNYNESVFSSNKVLQKIGSWSYSIYLWHWPIVVFMYKKSLLGDVRYILIGLIASFVLGAISYGIFESPLKAIRARVVVFISFALSVFSASIYCTYGADFEFRNMANNARGVYATLYSPEVYMTNEVRGLYLEKCNFYDATKYIEKEDIDASCKKFKGYGGIFIWGDSHAQALGQGIRQHYTKTPVYQIASSSCKPGVTPDTDSTGEIKKACDASNKTAIQLIERFKPKVVILAQHASHQNNDFVSIINKLKSIGVVNVILVGPVPQYDVPLPVVISARHWDKDDVRFADVAIDKNIMKTDKVMKEIYGPMKDVKYVSIIDELCNEKGCIAKIGENNIPMVWDYGHLTPEGSAFVTKNILSQRIDTLLK